MLRVLLVVRSCLTKRLYKCDKPEAACMGGQQAALRHELPSVGSAGSLGTRDQSEARGHDDYIVIGTIGGNCAVGYRNDTVKCSGCARGYDLDLDNKCIKCPSSWAIWLAFLGVILAIIILMFMMFAFLLHTMRSSERLNNFSNSLVEEQFGTNATAHGKVALLGLFTLALGSSQVQGQTSYLFEEDIPPYMREYMSFLNILSLDMLNTRLLVSFRCLAYTMDANSDFGGFYVRLVAKAATPWVVLLVGGICIWLAHWRSRLANNDNTMRDKYERYMQAIYLVMVFLIAFIHPSVSTTMFQIFWCEQVRGFRSK
eukprot:1190096-Prorocentrum_minimum.AAC.1